MLEAEESSQSPEERSLAVLIAGSLATLTATHMISKNIDNKNTARAALALGEIATVIAALQTYRTSHRINGIIRDDIRNREDTIQNLQSELNELNEEMRRLQTEIETLEEALAQLQLV